VAARVRAVSVAIARPGAEGAGAASFASQIQAAVEAVITDFDVSKPITIASVRTQVAGIIVVLVGSAA